MCSSDSRYERIATVASAESEAREDDYDGQEKGRARPREYRCEHRGSRQTDQDRGGGTAPIGGSPDQDVVASFERRGAEEDGADRRAAETELGQAKRHEHR